MRNLLVFFVCMFIQCTINIQSQTKFNGFDEFKIGCHDTVFINRIETALSYDLDKTDYDFKDYNYINSITDWNSNATDLTLFTELISKTIPTNVRVFYIKNYITSVYEFNDVYISFYDGKLFDFYSRYVYYNNNFLNAMVQTYGKKILKNNKKNYNLSFNETYISYFDYTIVRLIKKQNRYTNHYMKH